jgi:hypothetical protein
VQGGVPKAENTAAGTNVINIPNPHIYARVSGLSLL